MRSLRTIVREVFGLFVDDGSFAVLILAWVGVVTVVVPRLGWVPGWRGALLFMGLALVLMWSAVRYARGKRG